MYFDSHNQHFKSRCNAFQRKTTSEFLSLSEKVSYKGLNDVSYYVTLLKVRHNLSAVDHAGPYGNRDEGPLLDNIAKLQITVISLTICLIIKLTLAN